MIYFAQLPTGAIKIGKTDDIDRRMRGLKSQFKGPVLLLKTIPGGFKREWATHYRFRHLRVPGTEQFKPEPELMKFISKVKRVKPSSPRYLAIRSTDDYAAWVEEFTSFNRTTLAGLFDQALADFAEKKWFRKPPERT